MLRGVEARRVLRPLRWEKEKRLAIICEFCFGQGAELGRLPLQHRTPLAFPRP